jgi:4-diphosphocytidyl-2-C-methyl-D-erythritol kinase
VANSADQDSVRTYGEFAGQLTDPFDNIVARALSVLPHTDGLDVELEKNLPVAAGLGGGSADAGAIFRIIRELQGLPDDWRERAAKLGADVPACVESITCIGRGTGTELEPVASDLAGTPVLLVNPRAPLPTGPVFAAWDGEDRGPLPDGSVWCIAESGRNDLEMPALALCPMIGEVLSALDATGARLSRMSGSGATCFGIYRSQELAALAAEEIRFRHPDWWQMHGKLR